MPNEDLSEEVLNTTYIGLEYQREMVSRWQFGFPVWIYFLGGILIAVTAIFDSLPSIFGENIFTIITVCVWIIVGFIQIYIEYQSKLSDIHFKKQRLCLELDSEFSSNNPDPNTIKPEDVESSY